MTSLNYRKLSKKVIAAHALELALQIAMLSTPLSLVYVRVSTIRQKPRFVVQSGASLILSSSVFNHALAPVSLPTFFTTPYLVCLLLPRPQFCFFLCKCKCRFFLFFFVRKRLLNLSSPERGAKTDPMWL